MPSSGTWLVGSTHDFLCWREAVEALEDLTGDLTYRQVTAVSEFDIYDVPNINLNGYKLTFENASPHNGDPLQGNVTNITSTGDRVVLAQAYDTVGTGVIEVKDLKIVISGTGNAGFNVVAGTNVTANIHDVMIDATAATVWPTTGFFITAASSSATINVWNCSAGNCSQDGFIFSTAFGDTGNIYAENLVAHDCGNSGFNLGNREPIRLRNCVGFDDGTNGVFYQHGSATGYNNASDDTTAQDSNWGTSGGNITGINEATEFVSVSWTSTDYLQCASGGSLENGGTEPAIYGNDRGTRGNFRPHLPDTYSIGSDEFDAGLTRGTYTVGEGSVPADYASLEAAFLATAPILTGDLTFVQVSTLSATNAATLDDGSGGPLDLNGYALTIKSVNHHRGRPQTGHVIEQEDGSGCIFTYVTNGLLEVEHLDFKITGNFMGQTLSLAADDSVGPVEVRAHDLLLINEGYDPGDDQMLLLGASTGASAPVFRMWNCVVFVDDDNGGAFPYASLHAVSPSGNPCVFYIENCVLVHEGSNSAALAYNSTFSSAGDFAYLTNVAAIITSGSGKCFDLNPPAQHSQISCASTDSTADDAPGATGALNDIVVDDEFDGDDPGIDVAIFYAPSSSGSVINGGAASPDATMSDLNTVGIKGRPQRGTGGLHRKSIGAVEDEYVYTDVGEATVGTGLADTYPNWESAIGCVPLALIGDVTLTQTSNLTLTGSAGFLYGEGAYSGYKVRLTSDTSHLGVPANGHITTIEVGGANEGYAFPIFLGDDGTFEADNLNFSGATPESYGCWNGFYVAGADTGSCLFHDLIMHETSSPDAMCGFGIFVERDEHDIAVLVWNVAIDVVGGEWGGTPFFGIVDIYNAAYDGLLLAENCILKVTTATGAVGYFTGPSATSLTIYRNCVADVGGAGFYIGYGPSLADPDRFEQHSCASTDNTADDASTVTSPYNLIVFSEQFWSDDPANVRYLWPLGSGQMAAGGAAPVIPENTRGINGGNRPHSPEFSIGAYEFLDTTYTGTTITATDVLAESTMEGPQILVTWNAPSHENTTQIKLIRKLLAYPEDITDGIELLSAPIGGAPDYYVDLNPTINRAWCYALFTYHEAKKAWATGIFIDNGQTIVPSVSTSFFYEAQNRGTTGTSEPAWPTTIGETVQDNDIVWLCRGVNPGWITGERSRSAAFTWDSSYMRELPFTKLIASHNRNYDAESNLLALSPQQDFEDYGIWRAIREDGLTKKGELYRFLMMFGIAASRVKGATDFYPKLVDPDECLPQYLSQLAGILGWELFTQSPTQFQRQEILSAVPTYKVKGTVSGLESLLRNTTGVNLSFLDPMAHHVLISNRANRVGARGGQELAYNTWGFSAAYSRGDIVVPTGSNKTGYYYQAIRAGTTAVSEPAWPTVVGDDVTDGTVTWRTRQFGIPHLTADVSAGTSTLTMDDTSEFEDGKTINIRDANTPEGENIIIDEVVDSTTIELTRNLDNAYTLVADAVVSPSFDWHDDETGFIWDMPIIDQLDGIAEDRIRIPYPVIEDSALYSFEILRLWFIVDSGESLTSAELERVDRLMEQFAPADTRYVVRIEEA